MDQGATAKIDDDRALAREERLREAVRPGTSAHAYESREADKTAAGFAGMDDVELKTIVGRDRTRIIDSELQSSPSRERAACLRNARDHLVAHDAFSTEALRINRDLLDSGVIHGTDTRVYARALAVAHHARDKERAAQLGPHRDTAVMPRHMEGVAVDQATVEKSGMTDKALAQDILRVQGRVLDREDAPGNWHDREDRMRLKATLCPVSVESAG